MPEIILKTDMPKQATKFLVEALETETLRLKYSMKLAKRRLSKFEKKYRVTSKEFIKEWSAEDLEGKDLEYVEWAGEYNLSKRLNERLYDTYHFKRCPDRGRPCHRDTHKKGESQGNSGNAGFSLSPARLTWNCFCGTYPCCCLSPPL